jgi:Sec-independent protein translocase protein TatA
VPTRKASLSEPPPALLPLARFALVALVFGRERAPELLEGLGEREAKRAKEHLSQLTALSSAQRQARVAVEFGMRQDPSGPLRELMAEAPEALRRELFRRLPPYLRSLFPERGLEPPDASATPALCALAERLIREATR